MNDTELLQAIQQMIRDEMKDVKDRLGNVENDMKDVKGKLTNVENRLGNVEDKLNNVEDRLGDVEDRLGDVETEVIKTNLNIENRIIPYMQLLKEGYDGVRDTVNGLKKRTDNNEEDIIVLKVLEKIIEGFAKIK